MTDLEKMIFAYFVAEQAAGITIADRNFPYGELTLVWEDKFKVAVRKFGFKVRSKAKVPAVAFLDLLIEKGGYSTRKNEDFGGSMHAFQASAYKAIVRELQESDPMIQQARAEGPEFWEKAFSAQVAG